MKNQNIEIGTMWLKRGNRGDIATVVDILTTTNSQGEVVTTEYISEHTFMGQKIKTQTNGVTIIKGRIALESAKPQKG